MEFIIRLYKTYIILYTFNSDKHHVPINQKRSSDLNLNFEVKFLNSWLVNLYSNLKIEFNAKQDFFLFTLIKKSIEQLLSLEFEFKRFRFFSSLRDYFRIIELLYKFPEVSYSCSRSNSGNLSRYTSNPDSLGAWKKIS